MTRLTDLDSVLFSVDEHPVFVSLQDARGEHRLAVPGKKAIVNLSNQRVLGIVSRGYRLVSNQEALDLAYKCCRTVFPETSAAEWGVSAVDAPSTAGYCHIDLSHNSTALDFNSVPPNERPDLFGPFIRVTNSYNGLRALGFDIGYYRKVCKNGLILPGTVIHFHFTHMQREIGQTVQFQIAQERLAEFKATFTDSLANLRQCVLPRAQFETMVQTVLNLHPSASMQPGSLYEGDWQNLNSHIRDMSTRYVSELGETVYAAFNVITELASRPPQNRCLHRDRNSLQRLAGSWLTSFNAAISKPDFSIKSHLEQLAHDRNKTHDSAADRNIQK